MSASWDERPPTATEVGGWIDRLGGAHRTPAAVTGRLLEEATELALAAGLNAGAILAHVADALHNESKKAGVYPSGIFVAQPPTDHGSAPMFPEERDRWVRDIATEAADIQICLLDLAYRVPFDLALATGDKWGVVQRGQYRITPAGTFYREAEPRNDPGGAPEGSIWMSRSQLNALGIHGLLDPITFTAFDLSQRRPGDPLSRLVAVVLEEMGLRGPGPDGAFSSITATPEGIGVRFVGGWVDRP